MTPSLPSVLRIPTKLIGGLAAIDAIFVLAILAPWEAVVVAVVLGVFALGYRIGRSEG